MTPCPASSVTNAVSFLIRPLLNPTPAYANDVILKLTTNLEVNMTALYEESWDDQDPLWGAGHRCLTLSPNCLPPQVIYSACMASGVQWFDWIGRFGIREFELFVDPGCVTIRHTTGERAGIFETVWTDGRPSLLTTYTFELHNGKTIAQQLIERDAADDVFDLIDQAHDECQTLHHHFIRPSTPLSALSAHSRCSSRSSNSSSGLSLSSVDVSSPACSPARGSRRDRARQVRVIVDTSKNEVTPYDNGKTTVLTGGVMLGGAPTGKSKKQAPV